MKRFVEIQIKHWGELHRLARVLPMFVFRGQEDADWNLSTSIERTMNKFRPLISSYENKEYWILHEFKKKYHLYGNNQPLLDDNFEWLAILQHHGCPTRLLDFTRSIYIAAYFSVCEASKMSAIWGINIWNLRDSLHGTFSLKYYKGNTLKDEVNWHHIQLANEYIAKMTNDKSPLFVVPLETTKNTERISRQQGLFLMPLNLNFTFVENIFSSFGLEENEDNNFEEVTAEEVLLTRDKTLGNREIEVIKINIPNMLHAEALEDLAQMNITAESLFPGLDGFARSMLQTKIRT